MMESFVLIADLLKIGEKINIKPLRSSKQQIEKSLKSAKYFIRYSLDVRCKKVAAANN